MSMRRNDGVRVALLTYAASRLVLALVIGTIRMFNPGVGFDNFAGGWDASWFARVITEGYPSTVPVGMGNDAQSTLAFLPLYPHVANWFSWLTPFGLQRSLWMVNLLLGALAVVLWWRLVDAHLGRPAAHATAALISFFPGAYVFSMGYSEPLFLCLVAACLLALDARRWVWVGLWCALAGLTRANAAALIVAVIWVAAVEVRRSRDLRPLAAILIAPTGLVGFVAFVGHRTGQADAWFDVQRRGWGQHIDWGRHTVDVLWGLLHHPFLNFMDLVNGVTAVVALVGLALLVRVRVPLAWKIYAFGVIGLALMSENLLSTPRFTLTAVPVLVAYVVHLTPEGRTRLTACCAVMLGFLTFIIGTQGVFVP
jgi:hypothetical protein